MTRAASRGWTGMAFRTLFSLAVVALIGAGCASDSDTGPEVIEARGVSEDTVRVGGLATISGPGLAPFGEGVDVGAQARFARANAEGGVHGRQIEYVQTYDDTGSDNGNSDAVTRLLSDDIFAAVPVMTAQFGGAEDLAAAEVPFFGWGIVDEFCADHGFNFGFTGCVTGDAFTTSWPVLLEEHLGTPGDGVTYGLIATDDTAGRNGIEALGSSFGERGFESVYAEPVAPSSSGGVLITDATPIVAQVMTADDGNPPDIIVIATQFQDTITLSNALRSAGFDGILTNSLTYDPRIFLAPGTEEALQDTLVFLQYAPYEAAEEVPAIAQMVEDLETYIADEGLTQGLTQPVAAGYWSADLFLSLLEATGEDLSIDTFLDASDGFTHTVDGALGTTTWPEAHTIPVPCAALVRIDDASFVPHVPITCGEVVQR